MTEQINWARLVAQNRVKASGIPWTAEELEAIKNGMSPDDVRNGFLNKEEAESSKGSDKKIHHMTKLELFAKAQELGIEFDPRVVSRGDLILEVNKILKRQDQ